jgi:hypothetical protein
MKTHLNRAIRLLLAIAVLSALAQAQTPVVTLSGSKTTGLKPGDVVTITVALANQPPTPTVTMFQSILQGSKIALSNVTIATPALTQKFVDCNATLQCVIWGMNQLAIPSGATLTLTGTIAANASGSSTVSIGSLIATDGNGNAVPITSGPVLTLTISPKGDLNGDGRVDAVDVSIARDEVQGRAPCGTADLNGDGLCNVLDIQLVFNAVTP